MIQVTKRTTKKNQKTYPSFRTLLTCLLFSTLAVTGCATNALTETKSSSPSKQLTTQKTAIQANYQLPKSAFEGYWRVVKPSSQQHKVVSFHQKGNQNFARLDYYQCDKLKNYQKIKTAEFKLTPSTDGMLVHIPSNTNTASYIKVLRIVDKKAMILNQKFIKTEGNKDILVDEINFAYIYDDMAKPFCASAEK